MHTFEAMERTAGAPVILIARIAGVCWLTTIVASTIGMFISESLIVSGDAAATADNILTNKTLFQSAAAANLVATASYIGATVFVYELLKPVNKIVSLLAAFFSLTGCAVGAIGSLFGLVPFVVLGNAQYLKAFTPEQIQTLALIFLKVFGQMNNVGLVFFGLHCFFTGYLILKSAFIPRTVGVLMMLGGVSWLTFLVPPVANFLAPYNMAPGAIGEISLTLWLIVKGVDVRQWKRKADCV